MSEDTNWGIVGHAWAVAQLRLAIAGDRLGHAYLFSGPRGLGKGLLALRLAQALNCERTPGEPCGTCRNCGRIARGNHPDLRIGGMAQQAAEAKGDDGAKRRDLGIDSVRAWQGDITLKPYEAHRRVFILDDAERLTDAAANAMLKTLEEPPPYAVIILIAHTDGDLLPTIASRCRVLRLRPVARPLISAALLARGITADDATTLAAWSRGRAGLAFDLAQQPEQIEQRVAQIDDLAALGTRSRSERLKWADERAKEFRADPASVYQLIERWQEWWRDLLLTAAGSPAAVINVDRSDELTRDARTLSLAQIHGALTQIALAERRLRENVNPQLAFEAALLHLP